MSNPIMRLTLHPRTAGHARRRAPDGVVMRRRRCGRPAPAGGGCGAVRARTARPRCRTSRRSAGRTPGTRRAPRSRGRPPWPRGWTRRARGRRDRGRRRGSSRDPARRVRPDRRSCSRKSNMGWCGPPAQVLPGWASVGPVRRPRRYTGVITMAVIVAYHITFAQGGISSSHVSRGVAETLRAISGWSAQARAGASRDRCRLCSMKSTST